MPSTIPSAVPDSASAASEGGGQPTRFRIVRFVTSYPVRS
jgi:hypothetical protein